MRLITAKSMILRSMYNTADLATNMGSVHGIVDMAAQAEPTYTTETVMAFLDKFEDATSGSTMMETAQKVVNALSGTVLHTTIRADAGDGGRASDHEVKDDLFMQRYEFSSMARRMRKELTFYADHPNFAHLRDDTAQRVAKVSAQVVAALDIAIACEHMFIVKCDPTAHLLPDEDTADGKPKRRTDFQKLFQYVLEMCFASGARRVEKDIYVQRFARVEDIASVRIGADTVLTSSSDDHTGGAFPALSETGLWRYPTMAWRRWCSVSQFVNVCLSREMNADMYNASISPGLADKVADEISKRLSPEFPDLITNDMLYSVRNGVISIDPEDPDGIWFARYGSARLRDLMAKNPNLATRTYIDCSFHEGLLDCVNEYEMLRYMPRYRYIMSVQGKVKPHDDDEEELWNHLHELWADRQTLEAELVRIDAELDALISGRRTQPRGVEERKGNRDDGTEPDDDDDDDDGDDDDDDDDDDGDDDDAGDEAEDPSSPTVPGDVGGAGFDDDDTWDPAERRALGRVGAIAELRSRRAQVQRALDEMEHIGSDDPDRRGEILIDAGMMGRTLFRTGVYDHEQKWFMLLGKTRCGKGTILKARQAMDPHCNVAIFGDMQENFQLGHVDPDRCKLCMFMDIRSFKLQQTTFLSMVADEAVQVTKKQKTARSIANWSIPLIGAANLMPQELREDSSGAILQRTVVCNMNVAPSETVPTLTTDLLHIEVANILYLWAYCYRKLLKRGKPFSKSYSVAMIRHRDQLQRSMDPWYGFLADETNFHVYARTAAQRVADPPLPSEDAFYTPKDVLMRLFQAQYKRKHGRNPPPHLQDDNAHDCAFTILKLHADKAPVKRSWPTHGDAMHMACEREGIFVYGIILRDATMQQYQQMSMH